MEVVELVAGLHECEPVLVTVLVALRRNTEGRIIWAQGLRLQSFLVGKVC